MTYSSRLPTPSDPTSNGMDRSSRISAAASRGQQRISFSEGDAKAVSPTSLTALPPTTSEELFARMCKEGFIGDSIELNKFPEKGSDVSLSGTSFKQAIDTARSSWPLVDIDLAHVVAISESEITLPPKATCETASGEEAKLGEKPIGQATVPSTNVQPRDQQEALPHSVNQDNEQNALKSEDNVQIEMVQSLYLGEAEIANLADRIMRLTSRMHLGENPEGLELILNDTIRADGTIPSFTKRNVLYETPANGYDNTIIKYPILTPAKRVNNITAVPLNETGTFITEVSNLMTPMTIQHARLKLEQMKKMEADKELHTRAQMVEHATFPGFDQGKVTPLPNGLAMDKIIKKIVRTRDLSSHFVAQYKRWLLSTTACNMIQDVFWWCFLNRWKPAQTDDLTNLFTRISENYVKLFTESRAKRNDAIFLMYPDFVAQSVYTAFTEAFPRSSAAFGVKFQETLSDLASEWITGIKPFESACQKWNQMQNGLPKIQPTSNPVGTNGGFGSHEDPNGAISTSETEPKGNKAAVAIPVQLDDDFFAVLEKEIKKAESHTDVDIIQSRSGKIQLEPSCFMGPGQTVIRRYFDMYSNSPLVAHYISVTKTSAREQRTLKIHRSEVVREEAKPGRVTYREFVNESLKNFKGRNKSYTTTQDQLIKERSAGIKELSAELRKLSKEEKRAMGKLSDVKSISDAICDAQAPQDAAAAMYRRTRRVNQGPKQVVDNGDGSQHKIIYKVEAR